MATNTGETLSDLERRAEDNRAELAQTVDALYSRVTPDALKADARSYARDTGQHILDTLEARVRENPLQAMAIAAGVAYPVWRIIARMPAPVLLIGAGLALSRRGGGNGHKDLEARYRRAYDEDQALAAGSAEPGILEALKEKAAGVSSQIAEKAQHTVESLRSTASDKASGTAERVADAYQSGREAAAEAAQRASETYARTRENVASLIERHPLMVGAAAFAVGSLVASSLPVSRPENRLLGRQSDHLKHRAQDMALDGLHQARSAARQVYETAAEGVRQEGLTPGVARNVARSAVETAREAIEQVTEDASQSQPGDPSRNPAA